MEKIWIFKNSLNFLNKILNQTSFLQQIMCSLKIIIILSNLENILTLMSTVKIYKIFLRMRKT